MTSVRTTIAPALRTAGRWIWLPIALAAGTHYAIPRAMKRTFAPPQRDAERTPSDSVVPIENLHELAAAHPGAEVLMVPDGGHSDLARFKPHVGDITDFLNRHLA